MEGFGDVAEGIRDALAAGDEDGPLGLFAGWHEQVRRTAWNDEVAGMVADGQADVARIEAGRRAFAQRHAGDRQKGIEAWERANQAHAATATGDRVRLAASVGWWDAPGEVRIW